VHPEQEPNRPPFHDPEIGGEQLFCIIESEKLEMSLVDMVAPDRMAHPDRKLLRILHGNDQQSAGRENTHDVRESFLPIEAMVQHAVEQDEIAGFVLEKIHLFADAAHLVTIGAALKAAEFDR